MKLPTPFCPWNNRRDKDQSPWVRPKRAVNRLAAYYWTKVLRVEGLAPARFGRRIFTKPPPDVGRRLDKEEMLQLRQAFRPVPVQTRCARLRIPGKRFDQRRRFEAERVNYRQPL